MKTSHIWRFFRSGGFDQVRLETGEDLKALSELDPKLWVALGCPTSNLEFDQKTLEFLDTDRDDYIRVPEVIAAVKWVVAVLKNPQDIVQASDVLKLSAINSEHPDGKVLLASARQILDNIGKKEADAITAEDTADLNKIFANTQFNGDGIVPASAAPDEAIQAVIEDVLSCAGAEEDRSGQPGISEEKTELFFTEAEAYSAWWQEADQDIENILPLGRDTEAAKVAFDAISSKVDDFFIRRQLAEFDQRAEESLNPMAAEYEALAKAELSDQSESLAAMPIAKIEAGRGLPLEEGINPAWADAVHQFRDLVVRPLLGERNELGAQAWQELRDRFAAHQAWLNDKKGELVETLGIDRVREILAGDYREKILALIHKDQSFASALDAIDSVDKLIHYNRHLFQLLNNYVSFRDFYTGQRKAIFQAGSLYLDGRSCDFCLRITDLEKHSSMANLSGTYLAYCECSRPGEDEKILIAAAFTNGDADNLMVGRNGIFYDREGRDWNATIIKIVEHPISVSQAFWYPYKQIGKMIGEQVEKFASAREKSVMDQAAAGVEDASQKIEGGKAPAAPFDVGKFAGIFAAIGLAIGAIGTAIASVVTGFMNLLWWQMPLAIVGLVLLISGPSMLIAFLKLRKRNLAPLLDGNGWAINTRAIINIPFGTSLTQMATLPPGSKRSLTDPYAEKKTPWKSYLFILLLLGGTGYAWDKDYLHSGMFDGLRQQLSAVFQQPDAAEIDEEASSATEGVDADTAVVSPADSAALPEQLSDDPSSDGSVEGVTDDVSDVVPEDTTLTVPAAKPIIQP